MPKAAMRCRAHGTPVSKHNGIAWCRPSCFLVYKDGREVKAKTDIAMQHILIRGELSFLK